MEAHPETSTGLILRPVELEAVVAAPETLVVVAGHSGTGKSRLLARALEDDRCGIGALRELRRSDPLGFALFGVLGEALADGIESGAVGEAAASTLPERAGDLLETAATVAGKALVKRVFDKLTAGVGPEVKAGVREVLDAAEAATPAALAGRVAELGGESEVDLFVAALREVRALVGDVPITLALDRGERLKPEGIALLEDLADVVNDNFKVIVAAKTDEQRDVGEPDSERATVVTLGPLDPGPLQDQIPGLSPAAAAQLTQEAGDSALRLMEALGAEESDALALPAARHAPADAPAHVRNAARRLALFSDRPPARVITSYLGVSEADWHALDRELLEAQLLEPTVGARQGWFHELRRAQLLDGAPAAPADAAAALAALVPVLRDDDSWLAEGVDLAERAGDAIEDPGARGVMRLGIDAQAVMSAHLELSAPRQRKLLAAEVLRYAREQWNCDDAAAGVAELEEHWLLNASASDAGQSFLTRAQLSPLATALLRGRVLLREDRAPVASLADMLVTYVLAEPLGAALEVRTRVGPVTVFALAELESQLRDERQNQPTLMIASTFRGVPLRVAARFATSAERDAAAAKARGRHRAFGKWLFVNKVLAGPVGAQPAARWTLGRDELDVALDEDRFRLPLGEEALQARLDALAAFAERVSDRERWAAELDGPVAVGQLTASELLLEVEFAGVRSGVVELPIVPRGPDPMALLRSTDELPVTLLEHVVSAYVRLAGAPDESPLERAVDRYESRVRDFNKHQPPVVVSIEPDRLAHLLRDALEERVADARLLAGLLGVPSPPDLGVQDVDLFIPSRPGTPGLWDRERPGAITVWTYRPAGMPRRVRVTLVDRYDRASSTLVGGGLPPLDPGAILRVRDGGLKESIADLLGHLPEDIELQFPADERPAPSAPGERLWLEAGPDPQA